MSSARTTTLYYFHDPMCSWCWGFEPVWTRLKQALPADLQLEPILGGLAPDTDEPMPLELQLTIKGYWQKIEALLGTKFNYDFWDADKRPLDQSEPRRSTYPACRAVIAAGLQNCQQPMINVLQQAYYLRALNPSDIKTQIQLFSELAASLENKQKLDIDKFIHDLSSQSTKQELIRQLGFTRSMPIQGFPSLVLSHNGQNFPIMINYQESAPMLEQIKGYLDK